MTEYNIEYFFYFQKQFSKLLKGGMVMARNLIVTGLIRNHTAGLIWSEKMRSKIIFLETKKFKFLNS